MYRPRFYLYFHLILAHPSYISPKEPREGRIRTLFYHVSQGAKVKVKVLAVCAVFQQELFAGKHSRQGSFLHFPKEMGGRVGKGTKLALYRGSHILPIQED